MIIAAMDRTDPPRGAVRLTDWGLIRAQGADAASLLHSVLTQDVSSLAVGTARLAGLCSAKGRLLASFVVWRAADDQFLLACSADLLAPTLKRLAMFVLRARCRLSDATAEYALYGLAGAPVSDASAASALLEPWNVHSFGDGWTVRLPDAAGVARFLRVQRTEAAAPDLPPLSADLWAWLEVRSGVARICAATVEQFVPQMVNFERVGGVSFSKGCYPGQEVVARSQYRGTLKRRMQLFDCAAALHPGQEIFPPEDPGQPAGMVVNAAPRPGGGGTALVEVKLAALESGRLHAGSVDGPVLERLELPYPLPADPG